MDHNQTYGNGCYSNMSVSVSVGYGYISECQVHEDSKLCATSSKSQTRCRDTQHDNHGNDEELDDFHITLAKNRFTSFLADINNRISFVSILDCKCKQTKLSQNFNVFELSQIRNIDVQSLSLTKNLDNVFKLGSLQLRLFEISLSMLIYEMNSS